MDAESVILLDQLLELLVEEDILGVHVGEDQVDLGDVVAAVAGTVANDGPDDLQHGSDARTAGDHSDVTAHVGGVNHGTLGAAHLQGLAELQGRQVLGDVTLGVGLDEEIEVTGLIVRGDGSVGADDLLGLALDGGRQGDVLTDGQTQNIGGVGQREAVNGHIVGDLILLFEDEFLELGGVEDLPRAYRDR